MGEKYVWWHLPVVVGEIGTQRVVVEDESQQNRGEHHCLIHKRAMLITAEARRPYWRPATHHRKDNQAGQAPPPPLKPRLLWIFSFFLPFPCSPAGHCSAPAVPPSARRHSLDCYRHPRHPLRRTAGLSPAASNQIGPFFFFFYFIPWLPNS